MWAVYLLLVPLGIALLAAGCAVLLLMRIGVIDT